MLTLVKTIPLNTNQADESDLRFEYQEETDENLTENNALKEEETNSFDTESSDIQSDLESNSRNDQEIYDKILNKESNIPIVNVNLNDLT